MSALRFIGLALCLSLIAAAVCIGCVSAIASISGCNAFVGSATTPDPCPVRCSAEMCCPVDNECAPGGKCRPVAGPWGTSRDAGAYR